MSLPPWGEEVLSKKHERKSFDCGVEALNRYLQEYAWQNQKSGVSKTIVAVPEGRPTQILGYYSLAPTSIDFEQVPKDLARRLPRYPIPAYLLARLAVDKSIQGAGLGGQLLLGAGERCLAAAVEVGGVFMMIEAKDEEAALWYERFGAVRADANELLLMLPLTSIEAALKAADVR
jgi:GNAT superfamily N-acetyltransferase